MAHLIHFQGGKTQKLFKMLIFLIDENVQKPHCATWQSEPIKIEAPLRNQNVCLPANEPAEFIYLFIFPKATLGAKDMVIYICSCSNGLVGMPSFFKSFFSFTAVCVFLASDWLVQPLGAS